MTSVQVKKMQGWVPGKLLGFSPIEWETTGPYYERILHKGTAAIVAVGGTLDEYLLPNVRFND